MKLYWMTNSDCASLKLLNSEACKKNYRSVIFKGKLLKTSIYELDVPSETFKTNLCIIYNNPHSNKQSMLY